jgi:hypothetical protein
LKFGAVSALFLCVTIITPRKTWFKISIKYSFETETVERISRAYEVKLKK